jgi:hypothetical protein
MEPANEIMDQLRPGNVNIIYHQSIVLDLHN